MDHLSDPVTPRPAVAMAADGTVNFRQSSLKDMMMCAARYRFGTIEGFERVATGSMVAGTAFHKAIELALDDPYLRGPDDAEGFFKDGWAHAEERAAREGGVRWDEPKQKEATRTFIAFEDWFGRVLPTLPAAEAIELKFGRDPLDPNDTGEPLEVAPGITISGTIDYLEGPTRSRDWKTAKRAWVASDVEKDVQASMYSLAIRELMGYIPAEFVFEVWIKGNSPRHESYPTSRSDEDIERFIWLLKQYAAQVRTGVFPPNTNGWWCSARWCSFYELCPAAKGPLEVRLDAPEGGTPLEAEQIKMTGGVDGVTSASGQSAPSAPAASQRKVSRPRGRGSLPSRTPARPRPRGSGPGSKTGVRKGGEK